MQKPIPAPMPASKNRKPIGVLLAGGLSRRMGGGIKTFKKLPLASFRRRLATTKV